MEKEDVNEKERREGRLVLALLNVGKSGDLSEINTKDFE